ncbi:putative Arabinogalactan protein 26 [Hibiscus syriacus]|uniref:indole-3-pyruvate monooxygenase n=1 Tax=Hibiscus syriacus TaxID=106335 RepID=A0A6A2X9Z8_HIBSY|nr:putative Arabinogalactan protein 26 [Hibiscus syriacus]
MAIIVGAGPSGLATAASLSFHSIPYIILEREDCSASVWKKYSYDRLHLHLDKQISALPHLQFPDSYPKFVSRKEFISYLDDYFSHFKINPSYRRCVELAEFDEATEKWIVKARNLDSNQVEEFIERFLIVATGETCDPYTADMQGLKSFPGDVLHSTQYRNGKALETRKLWLSGRIHIVSKEILELGVKLSGYIPVNVADWLVGMVSQVLPTISNIRGSEVEFENSETHAFDTIVFCTGFKRSTHLWLKGDDCLLNEDGIAKQSFPNHWKGEIGCPEEDCLGQTLMRKT